MRGKVQAILDGRVSPYQLFNNHHIAIEYRPIEKSDGSGWEWHWLLLPLPDKNVALDKGCADSRSLAAIDARKAARKLKKQVTKVYIRHPSLTSDKTAAPGKNTLNYW